MLFIHNTFILRTPLFTFRELQTLSQENPAELRAKLLGNPAFCDAVGLSSKDLFAAINSLEDTKVKNNSKLDNSLFKYLIRLCTRPTNFSVLGTYSLGRFDKDFQVELDKENELTFYSSSDMVLLYHLYQSIPKDTILEKSRLYTNNNIYRDKDNHLKYLEKREMGSSKFSFRYSNFETNEVIEVILEFLKNGQTASELVKMLASQGYNIPESDLEEFLKELYQNNIIISSLDPVPSSIRYEKVLKDFFSDKAEYSAHYDLLCLISKTAELAIGGFSKHVTKVTEAAATLGLNLSKQALVNVETRRNYLQNTLPKNLKEDLLTAFKIVASTQEPIKIPEMDEFKDALFKIYENEFVPLTTALDPENGLGYPVNSAIRNAKSVFLSNLIYEPSGDASLNNPFNSLLGFDPSHGPLDLSKWKDFKLIELQYDKLYSSYYAKFSVVNSTAEVPTLFVEEFIGPSSGRIIARQTEDPEIKDLSSELCKIDEDFFENAVVAEIVFLPQIRAANIINNNNFFSHQIQILVPENPHQNIEISDLYLTIRNGKIHLFSKKLNKFVYPILANSFNYALTSIPLYNFLCDLQHQHTYLGAIRWKWPNHLAKQPYLPRVIYKNLIVSKAKWTIRHNKKTDFTGFKQLIQKAKDDRHIPDQVTMQDRGASMFLDLTDDKYLEIAYRLFVKIGSIDLEEFLFDTTPMPESIKHPQYINEYICFVGNAGKISNIRKPIIDDSAVRFNLGSEWLYVKIFCSTFKANNLLSSVLEQLFSKEIPSAQIKNWHYLRYFDENRFHIRLRIQLADRKTFDEVFKIVTKVLNQANSLIDYYIFDSFQPEVSRYGGAIFHDFAQQFFTVDSRYTLLYIQNWSAKEPWGILNSINHLLSDFGLDIEEKLKFCENSTTNYRNEFDLEKDRSFKKSVFTKYRENKEAISGAINHQVLINFFEQRSGELRSIVPQIKRNKNNLSSVIESILHLHIIRMLEARQRFQELIIYDLLAIHYREQIHRNKP